MKKLQILLLAIIISNFAFAQKIEKTFIGSWKLISVENTNSDGNKTFPYGTDVKGALFFDEKGNYAISDL